MVMYRLATRGIPKLGRIPFGATIPFQGLLVRVVP